ncbi:SDR family oxidoreductase [Aquibium sp. LZ166]|uniref:SDR family oxidoreductase n=1 Tax=Aquibium pacificus TaxID=3153579 RepID=A0ABV3SFG1_9HYPH
MPRSEKYGPAEVVVITGATAGVGRATARRFARTGARLVLIARDPAALKETLSEIEDLGSEAIAIAADVADAAALFAAADEAVERFGGIDIWINNAMATVFSPVAKITPEEFRRVTEVTYLGFVHGTMAALRHMSARNRGTILQVGSALAYRGIPLQAAYCGAKHAIRGFTDSLRTELIHDGSAVHLVMAHLPAVNTPQFDWARTHMDHEPRPVPPVVQPEVIAAEIHKAAHGRCRELWIGKSTIEVILGNALAPWFVDRYLARNAYEGQATDRPVVPERPDNLFGPVTALHRTRGSFGAEASGSAIAVSERGSRTTAAVAAIGLGLAAGMLLQGAISRRS